MGRGVFATRAIQPGEALGTFHAIHIPPKDARRMAGGAASRFWFEDDEDGSAYLVLGCMSLANHSLAPNADRAWIATREGPAVNFFAIRDIAPGDQLFIDYRFTGAPDDPAWARG